MITEELDEIWIFHCNIFVAVSLLQLKLCVEFEILFPVWYIVVLLVGKIF